MIDLLYFATLAFAVLFGFCLGSGQFDRWR